MPEYGTKCFPLGFDCHVDVVGVCPSLSPSADVCRRGRNSFSFFFLFFVVLQAAEALGAIGAADSVSVLERFASDPAPEVSQVNTFEVKRFYMLKDSNPPSYWR